MMCYRPSRTCLAGRPRTWPHHVLARRQSMAAQAASMKSPAPANRAGRVGHGPHISMTCPSLPQHAGQDNRPCLVSQDYERPNALYEAKAPPPGVARRQCGRLPRWSGGRRRSRPCHDVSRDRVNLRPRGFFKLKRSGESSMIMARRCLSPKPYGLKFAWLGESSSGEG